MFLVLLSVELYSTFRASSAQPSLVHFRVSQSSTLQIGAQRGAEAPRTFVVAVLPIAQQRISSKLPVGDDTIVTGTSVSCLSDPSSRERRANFHRGTSHRFPLIESCPSSRFSRQQRRVVHRASSPAKHHQRPAQARLAFFFSSSTWPSAARKLTSAGHGNF